MKPISIFFIFLIGQVRGASDDYYTAGVVEFAPKFEGSPDEILEDHLKAYKEIITSKEAEDTDILVFPEGTLNSPLKATFVPNGQDKVSPCDSKDGSYEDFLKELSCEARKVRKYVVINLTEKEKCPVKNDKRPCSEDGFNVYNTNVVFDRDGRVISRYRKTHLFEEVRNTTLQPELATFDTDFGVTFGHFICFDLLFYTPAVELVQEKGIQHLIMTTMFFSELPFLTAVQIQESWAWGNNVAFLAAGASSPRNGMTGSGIYLGDKGSLVSVMAKEEGLRKLYTAQVPKQLTKSTSPPRKMRSLPLRDSDTSTSMSLLQDPNITDFETHSLDIGQIDTSASGVVCMDDFCCEYRVVTRQKNGQIGSNTKYYYYRVGAFSGMRSYPTNDQNHIKVCAMFACLTKSQDSCAQVFPSTISIESSFFFKSIELNATFPNKERLVIMPSTLDIQQHPLANNLVDFQNKKEGDVFETRIKLTEQYDHIYSFGIYAKYYEKNSASIQMLSPCLYAIVLILICKRFFSN